MSVYVFMGVNSIIDDITTCVREPVKINNTHKYIMYNYIYIRIIEIFEKKKNKQTDRQLISIVLWSYTYYLMLFYRNTHIVYYDFKRKDRKINVIQNNKRF